MGKVLGIIAEYDPFHRGHFYHLAESKRITGAERTVCVMSGEFTQRGDPACYNKYLRAEAAIRNGVDLVIELPFVYACNNAEYFAAGAVDILEGLGCVDFLSFGSEAGSIERLRAAASAFAEDSPELNLCIKEGMAKGFSYPKAREIAVAEVAGQDAARVLNKPNNILGVEYLRRLISIGSKMEPVTVSRFAAGEDGIAVTLSGNCEQDGMKNYANTQHDCTPSVNQKITREGVAGATALRAMLAAGDDISGFISAATADVIAEYTSRGECSEIRSEDLFPLLLSAVSVNDREGLSEIFSASEGLENRLASAANRAASFAELVRYTKTKRYTETRIKRLIAHTVVGLTKNDMASSEAGQLYARVLAFGEGGAALLRKIRKTAQIPIITNPNKQLPYVPECEPIARFNRRASAVYRIMSHGAIAGFDDMKIAPRIRT
jgi:predicted nucleotidyltransferase